MAQTKTFGNIVFTAGDDTHSTKNWTFVRADGSTILAWYNRYERSWVVSVECNGGQCGPSEYVYSTDDVAHTINSVHHSSYCETPEGKAQREQRMQLLRGTYGI